MTPPDPPPRAPGLALIDHPDAITPDWLTGVIRANGCEAEVASLRASPVGTGQMADNYRLHIEYAARDAGAPETLVVKVPAGNETSRASGAAGGYITELEFYRELAHRLAVRTPRCWHADINDAHDTFILVLEDLAPAEQGDQIRGCSKTEAELAVRNLAGLHGSSWCDARLDTLGWLNRMTPEVAALFSNILSPRTDDFIARYESRMKKEDAEVLRRFATHATAWLQARPGRFAAVHGDYRLDNLLFGGEAGGAPVAAVDWQTLSIAHPGRDIAYFLGNAMEPDARREHEEALVRAYHEALLGHGVASYGFDECFDDYRFGQFQGPLVTVLGAMAVLQTERGDDMFMAMCSRSCQAIRDLDSLSLL